MTEEAICRKYGAVLLGERKAGEIRVLRVHLQGIERDIGIRTPDCLEESLKKAKAKSLEVP